MMTGEPLTKDNSQCPLPRTESRSPQPTTTTRVYMTAIKPHKVGSMADFSQEESRMEEVKGGRRRRGEGPTSIHKVPTSINGDDHFWSQTN